MADGTRSRKGGPDHTLEGAAPAPDDGGPRVLKSASLGRGANLSRRGFMRGAAGAGIAASLLGCGGNDGGSSESQLAKDCDRTLLFSHADAVTALAYAPDGQRLVTGSADGTLKLWNASTGELLRTLGGHAGTVNSVAFSPDGTRVASGGADQAVRVWNSADGAPLLTYAEHTGSVLGVAFFPSPQGARVASGSADGTVQVWDSATGALSFTYRGHAAGAKVNCVAVSPDGSRVASGGTDAVHVWSASGAGTPLVYTGHSEGLKTVGIASVAFFPDGTKIVSASAFDVVLNSGAGARIWDAASGAPLLGIDVGTSNDGEVDSVAVSPDGTMVALGCMGGWVKVLAASDGAVRFSSKAHFSWVLQVAFAPGGAFLASAGDDRTALVWDASAGAPVLAMKDPSLARTTSDPGRVTCDGGMSVRTPACTCDEVCTCDPLCTCDRVCTCDSEGGSYYYPN